MRRSLDPLPLLDVDAVRALAAKDGVKEQHLLAVWRAVVREGHDLAAVRDGGLAPRPCSELLARCAMPSSHVVDAIPTTAQKGFKLVVGLQDGQRVETVAIVHEVAEAAQREAGGAQGRITVCVSSQVGCKMGCTFCATGSMGFKSHLTAGEIAEQVWHVERAAPRFGIHWRVTNVVYMGMGEPLNNYNALVGSLRALRELWELAPSRITVSTVGVVNRMRSLAADAPGINLALSLHAASQETRLRLVPSSRAYTVEKLMLALDDYCAQSGKTVMVEYILIRNVNDMPSEAHALAALLRGRSVHLNLIPYNRTAAGDGHGYESPTDDEVRAFAAVLGSYVGDDAIAVTVRWSSAFARDVDGACGQLALVSEQRPPHEQRSPLVTGAAPHTDIEDLVAELGDADVGGAAGGAVGGIAGGAVDGAAGVAGAAGAASAALTPLGRQLGEDSVPGELRCLYDPRVLAFDRDAFDFHGPLRAALGQPDLCGLRAEVTSDATLIPAMQHSLLCAGISLPPEQRRAGAAAWLGGGERKAFLAAYRDFVRRVVLPAVDVTGCGRLVYQAEPTLRVSLPGARPPGGKPRCSAEYFHQAGELAFWVPLTPGRGSNTMHTALEPGGAAEVKPLELSVGECASWYGTRLRSGFVANGTQASGVGFDFHVIPWPLYQEDRTQAKRSSHALRLDGYYALLDVRAPGGGSVTAPPEGCGDGGGGGGAGCVRCPGADSPC